jgi:hypothetical protein
MNIDFDLTFLYYQEVGILDGVDPKMEELYPHIDKFKVFVNTASLSDLLQLACISYKEKYGQEHYWFDQFLIEDAYKIETVYPDDLDEKIDLYLPKEKITRKDLKHLTLRMFDDINKKASFMKEMEVVFKESQEHLLLSQSIEEVSFTREDTPEDIVFTVLDSPIASITINATTFKMVINQGKCVRYFG